MSLGFEGKRSPRLYRTCFDWAFEGGNSTQGTWLTTRENKHKGLLPQKLRKLSSFKNNRANTKKPSMNHSLSSTRWHEVQIQTEFTPSILPNLTLYPFKHHLLSSPFLQKENTQRSLSTTPSTQRYISWTWKFKHYHMSSNLLNQTNEIESKAENNYKRSKKYLNYWSGWPNESMVPIRNGNTNYKSIFLVRNKCSILVKSSSSFCIKRTHCLWMKMLLLLFFFLRTGSCTFQCNQTNLLTTSLARMKQQWYLSLCETIE